MPARLTCFDAWVTNSIMASMVLHGCCGTHADHNNMTRHGACTFTNATRTYTRTHMYEHTYTIMQNSDTSTTFE